MNTRVLRTAIVGLGGPGREHAKCLAGLTDDFEIVAGCDMAETARAAFAAEDPRARVYGDFAVLLAKERPDVVVLATSETPRCALTLQAVAAGVRGLYVEKPMAVSLGEARKMLATCTAKKIPLLVNHQRRTLTVFRKMRQLIADDAIGEVTLIRASCAGDLLCDGTHLVNMARFLYGDPPARWISAMVNLGEPAGPLWPGEPPFSGRRFGRAAERGAVAIVAFEGGGRAEFHTGALQIAGSQYQYYEVIGSKGRLLRNGDAANPPVLMQRESAAGWHAMSVDEAAVAAESRMLVPAENYLGLAAMMRGEAIEHPLDAHRAILDHEILMAAYESARRHERITLPLQEDAFPLELLMQEQQQKR